MRVVLPRKKGPVKCAILHGAAPKRAGLLFEFEAAFGRRPQGFWIVVTMRHGRSMRIAGWVLLVSGFLLCVSILSAALGFLLMGFGLIFLQIAEQKNKSQFTSDASRSAQSEPQWQPASSRALAPSEEEEREVVDRESAIGPNSYDRERWRLLLRNDADISRLVAALAPYGQKYVDQLAAAYLARNDKDYLPMILTEIVASARRDSGVAGDPSTQQSNEDAVGMAFDRTRRFDRLRDVRSGYIDKPTSVENVPNIDASPEGVAEPSRPEFSGDVGASLSCETAVEEATPAPEVTHVESNGSPARQIAGEATDPKPPAEAAAAVHLDEKSFEEKKGTPEVDAVDADNLAEILNQLDPALPPKTK
jgi:hypothetical protein